MNHTTNVNKFATEKEAREHLKVQLADYLKQQPISTQLLHKWMMRLEAAGAGIIAAAFIVALYVSVIWKSINPIMIPIAWFVFAASAAPYLIFLGLDAITLQAFPPVIIPGRQPKFITGSGAVWTGWVFILGAIVLAVFWGFFAYAVGTFNMAMIVPLINILGVVISIGIVISIVYRIIGRASRSM